MKSVMLLTSHAAVYNLSVLCFKMTLKNISQAKLKYFQIKINSASIGDFGAIRWGIFNLRTMLIITNKFLIQLGKFTLLCFLWLFSIACSMTKMAANQTTAIIIKAAPAFDRESDLELAEQAILSNLKVLEGLLEITPDNPDLLLITSNSFSRYAFAFVEHKIEIADHHYQYEEKEKMVGRAIDFYYRGKDYGLRLLSKSRKNFPELLEGDLKHLSAELQRFHKKDVPALFWTAYAWGNIILLQQSSPARIAELPIVDMIMQRVLELDETYFFGGPHLFYGGYFGNRPKTLGGDPAKAREHVLRAIEITKGKFLMAKFLLAKFYAAPAQDRGLFKSTLEEILAAPDDLYPEQTLANNLAKRDAARWLQRIDEILF